MMIAMTELGECNGRYNTVEPSAKKSFWCIIGSQKICIDNIDVIKIYELFEKPHTAENRRQKRANLKSRKTQKILSLGVSSKI